MTLYEGLYFFIILASLSLVSIYLGLREKSRRNWILLSSSLILILVFAQSIKSSLLLLSFLFFQYLILQLFMKRLAKGDRESGVFMLSCLASLTPLFLVRVAEVSRLPSLGFLGISYMSFRALQYIIEVWDGLITELHWRDYFSFLIFFPSLSSGPIDRSRRFDKDLSARISRQEYQELLAQGILYILQGLVYKMILAQFIYDYMKRIEELHASIPTVLAYMYSYGFYLFFDFAGYSLMAVGTAYIWGVRLPMNFNKPFISQSPVEFWNRWHISLSTWFRDFVFSRLMIRAMKNKWFKKRSTSAEIAYMINMTLMGFWHGFTVSYVLYGLYHGLLLAFSEWYFKKSKLHKKHHNKLLYKGLSIFATFHLVMFGFFIFSGRFQILFTKSLQRLLGQ